MTSGVDDGSVALNPPPRTPRRRSKARYSLPIIGILALIFWWSRPEPDTLLLRSKRLKIGNLDVLGWATDRYLLACTPFNSGNPKGCLIDVATGEQKSLDGLNAALSNAPPGVRAWFPWNRVSPDGKWMLWGFAPSRVPIKHHHFATRLDGSRTIEWVDKTPTWRRGPMIWLPDSTHWVRATVKRRPRREDDFLAVEEYSVDDPKTVKRYPFHVQSFDISGWKEPGQFVSTSDNMWRASKSFQYRTVSYTKPSIQAQTKSIMLPEESLMTEIRLSQNGRRIIVSTTRSETNMWLEMTRFIRQLAGWDSWLTVWTCTPDDMRLRELGRVRSSLWGNGISYWLIGPSPSGNKVAYMYRGSCYVASVP